MTLHLLIGAVFGAVIGLILGNALTGAVLGALIAGGIHLMRSRGGSDDEKPTAEP
jgi:hypothetical protein